MKVGKEGSTDFLQNLILKVRVKAEHVIYGLAGELRRCVFVSLGIFEIEPSGLNL